MPLFTGTSVPNGLTADLARILFPVVLLLGLTGLLVGILQSLRRVLDPRDRARGLEHRDLVLLVALKPQFHSASGIYAYAIAWLVATVVQMVMVGERAQKDRLPPAVLPRLARPPGQAGVRADAAGHDRAWGS